jgi:hypothetical protein
MTQDEIIEIANKAGIVVTGEAIYTLCKLVAQHEREACAKLAENTKAPFTATVIRARAKE